MGDHPTMVHSAVYTTLASPVGELLLVGTAEEEAPGGVLLDSVSMVPAGRSAPDVRPGWRRDPAPFAETTRQLLAYFDGEPIRFELAHTTRGTEFQRRVWDALAAIPYGTTTTYGELAAGLGVARGEVRAVGAALGANPLLVVRPCHRVIGADGGLRGYAGGVERKQWLLVHEGALQPTLC